MSEPEDMHFIYKDKSAPNRTYPVMGSGGVLSIPSGAAKISGIRWFTFEGRLEGGGVWWFGGGGSAWLWMVHRYIPLPDPLTIQNPQHKTHNPANCYFTYRSTSLLPLFKV